MRIYMAALVVALLGVQPRVAWSQEPEASASPPPAQEEGATTETVVEEPTEEAAAESGSEPSASPPPAAAEGSYNLKLRSIEERVNQLKEKIFQSKARLMQLQEVVLHGSITGSKAVLIHRNEMGSSFRLWRVQYSLDGAPIFNRVDSGSGELNDVEEVEVFAGGIAPGNHQLSVYLEYHGHGYGIFSYLKGYKFKIKSSYTFTAEEGMLTTVKIVGYEKGGITTELKDRPAVRYERVGEELKGKKEGGAPAK